MCDAPRRASFGACPKLTLAALALACLGMWLGQIVRLRLSPAVFGRGFFIGLLLLGLYQFVEYAD